MGKPSGYSKQQSLNKVRPAVFVGEASCEDRDVHRCFVCDAFACRLKSTRIVSLAWSDFVASRSGSSEPFTEGIRRGIALVSAAIAPRCFPPPRSQPLVWRAHFLGITSSLETELRVSVSHGERSRRDASRRDNSAPRNREWSINGMKKWNVLSRVIIRRILKLDDGTDAETRSFARVNDNPEPCAMRIARGIINIGFSAIQLLD